MQQLEVLMSNHCSWSYLCRSCVAASLVWLVSPQKADAQVVILRNIARVLAQRLRDSNALVTSIASR